MSTVTVFEKRDVTRDYGLAGVEAIIEHPTAGRLLIADGFGGTDSLAGGAVRWRHGLACRLWPDDTFDVLDQPWNAGTSLADAVTAGHDNDRPVLDWSGRTIASVAAIAGL